MSIIVGDNIYTGQPHDIIAGLQAEIERLRAVIAKVTNHRLNQAERHYDDMQCKDDTIQLLRFRLSTVAAECVEWRNSWPWDSSPLIRRTNSLGGPEAWVMEDGTEGIGPKKEAAE